MLEGLDGAKKVLNVLGQSRRCKRVKMYKGGNGEGAECVRGAKGSTTN